MAAIPGLSPGQVSAETRGTQVWAVIDEMIMARMKPQHATRARFLTINANLAGSASPVVGPLTSVAITVNARIVGYEIFALAPGQLVVEIQRSTPTTHASGAIGPNGTLVFPSMIGAGAPHPAINGVFVESLDTTLWASRIVAPGDMLHFSAISTDNQILYVTMGLYLQDMDEKVQFP